MELKRGILIHPGELDARWEARVLASSLTSFGLHPVGGLGAEATLEAMRGDWDRLAPHLAAIRAAGVEIEHEMHALRWMLPASEFAAHPDWFRENEAGERTADYNLCPSNSDALAFVAERAETLARLFPSSNHRYHFWIDDVRRGGCRCAACRALSEADQAMRIYNAILAGVRRADPLGTQAYLAYHGTLAAPRRVGPETGIFLEYAPIERDWARPLDDADSEANRAVTAPLPELLSCFGTAGASACEYWLDNSLLSRWKKPPKRYVPCAGVYRRDAEMYGRLGFSRAVTFACYLGADYEALWGGADVDFFLQPGRA